MKYNHIMNEEEIIRMLDNLTQNEVSRIKINVDEDTPEAAPVKEYHHGRCDVGSPWACGTPIETVEDRK